MAEKTALTFEAHTDGRAGELAFCADRVRLPFRRQAERPLEQRRGWGCGFRLRPFGFTGSSAMNSAHENSDRCRSEVSSRCPFSLVWLPLPSTSSTVDPTLPA